MSASTALQKPVGLLSLVLIGLLAGILIGSGMDQFAAAGLSEESWLAFRNTNSWVFPAVMPWMFNGTLVALIAAAILKRAGARWLLAAAALLCAAAIFVTVRIEVPMNHVISSWTAGAAPSDWAAVRDHWLRMHLVRTILGTIAFVLAAIGLART